MHIQTLTTEWTFRQADSEEWLPAQVPGGVHTDLLAAGRIPDPFVADNEKQVQWVTESNWEYRQTFIPHNDLLAEEQIFLICDGLDTLTEVILNGQLLGKTENMFRRYRWEVKDLLREGDNHLDIFFSSPVEYITTKQAERPMQGVAEAIDGSPHLRKSPCQFGWDWGPMLPPIGIWKNIRLEGHSVAQLDDIQLRQRHAEDEVTIEVKLNVERWRDSPLLAKVLVTTPDDSILEVKAGIVEEEVVVEIPVDQPQLWWPNGYGAQPLYQVEILLLEGERVLDQQAYQLGLRTIELRQEDDEWGTSFTFVINGVPIFAKGSNWIPADSFPTRLTEDHLDDLIRSAVLSNQNMIRVWGGGLYEED